MPPSTELKIDADIVSLKGCSVFDENGTAVPLESLWEKQTAIFVFLRHFACDACRKHAVEVWENRKRYEECGAKIHFIGNGSANFMTDFKEKYGLQSASFFTDPSLKTFRAAGFKKGFWIDPGAMHSRSEFLYKALRFTARQENADFGNVWQLGGVLVVKPGGLATYQFISMKMGHFPPSNDIPTVSGKTTSEKTD